MPLIEGRNKIFLQTHFLAPLIYSTSHLLTAPASTSWVTHVLFVATTTTCVLFVATTYRFTTVYSTNSV